MKGYLITYDLTNNSNDYNLLINKIEEYDGCCEITESTWYVQSSKLPSAIRDDLLSYIKKNDRILVAELNGSAAWNNILGDSNKLKNSLEKHFK